MSDPNPPPLSLHRSPDADRATASPNGPAPTTCSELCYSQRFYTPPTTTGHTLSPLSHLYQLDATDIQVVIMTSKDPVKQKRVTFAGASEDEEAEMKATEGPEAATQDLQTTTEPASHSFASSGPAISKLASRKAQLTGLMTAGAKPRQMKKWEKEYKAVEKELDEARGHVTPIFTAGNLRKAD